MLSLVLGVTILSTTGIIANGSPYSKPNESLSHPKKIFSLERNCTSYEQKINPYNGQEVAQAIILYDVMPETAEAMRHYSEACMSGEIKEGELTLITQYNPFNIDVDGISTKSVTPRTYRGFGGRNYLEEKILLKQTSGAKTIYEGNKFSSYLNDTIDGVAGLAVDSGLDIVTFGTWSIGKVFTAGLPTGVPVNTSFRHESRLIENKTQVFTYIENTDGWGGYSLGSRVELDDYSFSNEAVFPGYYPVSSGIKLTKTLRTPGYTIPDTKAYYGYVNGGWIEKIESFIYGGTKFYSVQ